MSYFSTSSSAIKFFAASATVLSLGCSSLTAQIATPDSLQKLKDPAAHAAKQNAISAKGSKMAIEKSNQLAIATMIERSRAVTASNAKFFKDVAASKVLPFEKLQKRYVEEFPRKLDSLSA